MIAPETTRAVGVLARILYEAFARNGGYCLSEGDFSDDTATYWMEHAIEESGVAGLIGNATALNEAVEFRIDDPRAALRDNLRASLARYGASTCTLA